MGIGNIGSLTVITHFQTMDTRCIFNL